MTFTVVDVPQRSPEWFAARLGRLTGSRAADMMAQLKSGKGEAAGRRNLRVQLALERITGRPQESTWSSPAMQQGADREYDACLLYESLTGRVLRSTGFIACDGLMAGCSLDGHVGEFEGIVEIKSPIPATHLDYLRTGTVPGDYYKQCLHSLWVTGAEWCDWLSYNPDFPEPLRSKLVRIHRNEQEIAAYNLLARQFLKEVDEEVASVNAMLEAVA